MIITEKPNKLTVDKLEEIYVEFHERVKTDPKIEDEGSKWFKKLEDGDKEARQIWQECVRVSLEEFNRIYEMFGGEN